MNERAEEVDEILIEAREAGRRGGSEAFNTYSAGDGYLLLRARSREPILQQRHLEEAAITGRGLRAC